MTGHAPIRSLTGLSVRAGGTAETHRALAEETPVALVYNGTTQAVMMASPEDIEDFALGFSVTEGIVARPGEIESLEIVEHGEGLEARMWIAEDRAARLAARRRAMTGPIGCGLCGIDSLGEALRPVPPVADVPLRLEPGEIAGRHGRPARGPGAARPDPCRPCGRVLGAGPGPCAPARGRRPAQRARQARGRGAAGGARPARARCF
jgi:hypothetical protein